VVFLVMMVCMCGFVVVVLRVFLLFIDRFSMVICLGLMLGCRFSRFIFVFMF